MSKSMTVAELIEELESMDPDAKVMFAYQSGDHWRTVVCEPVESVDEEEVKWSEYHRKYELVGEDEADDGENEADDEEDRKSIVLLQ